MARITSLTRLKQFVFGADAMQAKSGEETALGILLDSVSVRIETEIYGTIGGMKQQSFVENYGTEHYRAQRKNIRLRHHLNITAVTEVDDDGSVLAADDFVLDSEKGIIYLQGTRKFAAKFRAVQVTYTAGYADNGSGDDQRLLVPADLEMACMQQCTHEWGLRKPGSGLFGMTSVARPDGTSVSVAEGAWVPQVLKVLKRYKR